MSIPGPMNGARSVVKRRVRRASSPFERTRGLQRTPPFAPPYGSRRRAHFQVIHIASAAHSPRLTARSKRTPPLVGPSTRSEERRVGKEGRSTGGGCEYEESMRV